MKVSLAQLNYTVGDFEGNKQKILRAIHKAIEAQAKLVVFGEQAIGGVPSFDYLQNVLFLDKCKETLEEIAPHCKNITALIGLPLYHEGGTISAMAVVQNGVITRYVGKKIICLDDEMPYLTPSKGCEYVKIGNKHVAIILGHDLLTEEEFGDYADFIVSCSKSRYARGIVEKRYDQFARIAYKLGKPLLCLNHIGGNADIVYDGSSMVYNANGESIAVFKSFEEDFQTIDLNALNPKVPLLSKNKTVNIYKAIKLGLRDYFQKNGFRKACLGLSGGIDSAVVAALTTEVLGPENVRVLLLPSQFSSEHSITDAVELAQTLGIQYEIIPIHNAFDTLRESLNPLFGDLPFNVTEENIQSRIRGVLLMALSNKFGHILLNTTNKSEAAMGYGTLYGDSAGSLSILGDIYKTEVYDVARYINRNRTIIPENTLDKEPSAELRPNQKDSDSLPDYPVLDTILFRIIENRQSVEEVVAAGYDEVEVRRIQELLVRNEYKRYQSCPILRMSVRSLGKDLILPLAGKHNFL